jgi:hypothetical protein
MGEAMKDKDEKKVRRIEKKIEKMRAKIEKIRSAAKQEKKGAAKVSEKKPKPSKKTKITVAAGVAKERKPARGHVSPGTPSAGPAASAA